MVETKRELRVKKGISDESTKKAAIPFTDYGLYIWCRRPAPTGRACAHYTMLILLEFFDAS